MTDRCTSDTSPLRGYDALVAKVDKGLDVDSGLAAALDVAGYRHLRTHVAQNLDVDTGLQDILRARNDSPQGLGFHILGPTAIRVRGRMITDWGRPRERAVLAVLLLYAGRVVPMKTILQWAWPEDVPLPRNVPTTLHTYATRIRRSLRAVDHSVRLIARNGGYLIDVDPSTIDYHRFRALRIKAQALLDQGQPRPAAAIARQATGLWREQPVGDMAGPRAENWHRGFLTSEWLSTNITLLTALLEVGEVTEAVARLDDLQSEHPNNLTLIKLRLTAFCELAQFTDATAYYLHARRQLVTASNHRAAERLRQFYDNLREKLTRTNAPTGAARDVGPRQLPASPCFVGRDRLLSLITDASAWTSGGPETRVIVLEGPPGIGKTSLAVHWAHAARHRFPDGDLFVNLRSLSEQPDVAVPTLVENFLTALGHAPDPDLTTRAKERLLRTLLSHRRTLVVLDDARDPALVEDVVPLLSGCLVIVTTRQKDPWPDDVRRIAVDPMSARETSDLLAARLRGRQRITDKDLGRLVRLSGGIPLVVSVLAEQVARQPADQMAKLTRLTGARVLVDIGIERVPPTADAFFAWSYQALAAPEQRLFRLLGLHSGPDLSAETACSYDDRTTAETRRSLETLVRSHLLDRTDSPLRYRFHDLVQQFAASCAERDESLEGREAAEVRGISHYIALAAQARRQLLTSNAATSGFWMADAVEPVVFTNAAQAQSWFDQERTNLIESIHTGAARGHHRHSWQLAELVAVLFERNGHYENSRLIRERAVTVAGIMGDRKAEASSLVGLGGVHIALGSYAEAHRCLTAGLRYAEDNGSERGQAAVLQELGRLEMLRDAPFAATPRYQQALDIMRKLGDLAGQCWTHCCLGEAYRELGQYESAFEHLHHARSVAQRIGDQSARAKSLFELAAVHRDLGDLPNSTKHCEDALLVLDFTPTPDLALSSLICIALAESKLGQNELNDATRYAQRAMALSQQTCDNITEARCHEILGDIQAAYHDHVTATEAWRAATDLYERTGMASLAAVTRGKIDATQAEPAHSCP